MNNSNEISGVIYPLMRKNFNLLRKKRNPIYIKYITHTASKYPTRLIKGNFLLFYLSGENKSVVGYSKIIDIGFDLPSFVKEHFLDRIQMKEQEFDNYIKYRETKPLLILQLDEIKELSKSVVLPFSITMTGKYIYESDIKKITDVKI